MEKILYSLQTFCYRNTVIVTVSVFSVKKKKNYCHPEWQFFFCKFKRFIYIFYNARLQKYFFQHSCYQLHAFQIKNQFIQNVKENVK